MHPAQGPTESQRAEQKKVRILGIGDDGLEGLTPAARSILEEADLIIGSAPAVAAVPPGNQRRVACEDPVEAVQHVAAAGDARVVVLAGGDPLFYGTARYLCDQLGKERFEVVPHVSSMQLAFARVKERWDEAYLSDLANQPLELVVERIRTAQRVGLFTTEACSAAAVARALLNQGIDYFTAYVCENLGSPDERVTHGRLAEIANQDFGALNVMILVRDPDAPDRPRQRLGRRLFGNPDECFAQSLPKRGLLTPAEVRCVALAEMDLGPASTVWDVGAGSGSVAVEAAQIAQDGHVCAIEMDPEDHQLIKTNAATFGVTNLRTVLGKAPDAWQDLPDPDAIFIGGTGRQVSRIVEQAYDRLRPGGRLVVNIVSIENLADVQRVLHGRTGDAVVRMIQIARGMHQLETTRFESVHPTFLISAVKPSRP